MDICFRHPLVKHQWDKRSRVKKDSAPGDTTPAPILCLAGKSSIVSIRRTEIMSQQAVNIRKSPYIDTYIYLEREMTFWFFFFFLPIPSEYANTWLSVFDNGNCPLIHTSYYCLVLHLPVLWRQNSSWPFSSYFQMNPTSSALFLSLTLNFFAPCSSHLKDQCDHTHPTQLPGSPYFQTSASNRQQMAFFILCFGTALLIEKMVTTAAWSFHPFFCFSQPGCCG